MNHLGLEGTCFVCSLAMTNHICSLHFKRVEKYNQQFTRNRHQKLMTINSEHWKLISPYPLLWTELCLPTQLYIKALTPSVMVFQVGPLGSDWVLDEVMRVRLWWWDYCSCKKRHQRTGPLSLLCVRITGKQSYASQGESSTLETDHAGTLKLDLYTPELWDNEFQWFQPPRVCNGSLSWPTRPHTANVVRLIS